MTSKETFRNIQKKIQEQVGEKLQARFGERWSQSAQKVSQATQIATETAKIGLQQALDHLERQGLDVRDPKAFAQSVGKKALVQAERIRSAVAENPFSPAWLRDVSFAPQTQHVHDKETAPAEAAASGSIVESVISEAAEDMHPDHDVHHEEEEAATEEKGETKKRRGGRGSKGAGSASTH